MSKKTSLIPAVGYLRKSTKGERAGRQKQEKSIPSQKAEITKLATGKYAIVAWYVDEGVSGWKRGRQRPDFDRMLEEIANHKAQAVLCDNLDRFSRASVDEVQADASELRKAGCRWIVTASHGEYDLGKRHDIGEILKFVVAVWSANEYSRQLSRRITMARRNAAEDGKRTGGSCAYGYAQNAAKDGLTLDTEHPERAKVVQWIFDQFVNHGKSINWICSNLNSVQKIPGPSGSKWYVRTIQQMLQRRVYRGDFVYNRGDHGQFHTIDGSGNLVEKESWDGSKKIFVKENAHEPIIDAKVFDKAVAKLKTFQDKSRRKRMGYALTGILVCGHCGGGMHGCQLGGHNIYRCGTNADRGQGACGHRQIREDAILPYILNALSEEIDNLQTLLTDPPDELRSPRQHGDAQRKQTQARRDKLANQIVKAEKNLLLASNEKIFKRLEEQIIAMQAELAEIDAELNTVQEAVRWDREEWNALVNWYRGFERDAVSMPVKEKHGGQLNYLGAPWDPESHDGEEYTAVLADPIKVNEALHHLGCQVKLWWKTNEYVGKRSKKSYRRHELNRGRLQLGQTKDAFRFHNSRRPRQPVRTPFGAGAL